MLLVQQTAAESVCSKLAFQRNQCSIYGCMDYRQTFALLYALFMTGVQTQPPLCVLFMAGLYNFSPLCSVDGCMDYRPLPPLYVVYGWTIDLLLRPNIMHPISFYFFDIMLLFCIVFLFFYLHKFHLINVLIYRAELHVRT